MRLIWSAFARSDRNDIFTHIEADSPRAAIAVDERIAAVARRLVEFPESGRPARVPRTRERVVTGTPDITAYAATTNSVRILRVLRGAQIWPDDFPES